MPFVEEVMSYVARAARRPQALGPSKPPAVTFEDFYAAEYSVQVRRAYLLVGSQEDSREIVQDAFVEVFQRWAAIEEPGPYVNRIVVNRCRDRYRRTRRGEASECRSCCTARNQR